MAVGEGRERGEGCLVGVGVFSKPAVWGAWAGGCQVCLRLFPDRQASMLLLASHLLSTASSHHAVLHSVFSFVFNRQGIFQFFSFLIFNHVLSLKQH